MKAAGGNVGCETPSARGIEGGGDHCVVASTVKLQSGGGVVEILQEEV